MHVLWLYETSSTTNDRIQQYSLPRNPPAGILYIPDALMEVHFFLILS